MSLVNVASLDFSEIKESIKSYLRADGNFTDYKKEVLMNDEGVKVDENLQKECWYEVEKAVDACKEKASELWDQYYIEGIIEQVEKEIRQSIYIFKLIDEKIKKQFWCDFN